jgi:hypothetical protein
LIPARNASLAAVYGSANGSNVRYYPTWKHSPLKERNEQGCYREERKVYKVLVGKSEGRRPLGRPRRRWEDGVRMDLRETGFGVWIGFGWLRTGIGGGGLL